MIKNEERLYHVVVSFPSICAKEFLILKFKRNEAICCLIGFGIGISCCLMYRWLKSYFFISNQTTANDEYYDYDAWSLNGNQEKKYLETGLMLNAASSKCTESLAAVNIKYSKKNRTKANKTSHGISKSNSNTSISTNNSGCCCCCCCLNKKTKSISFSTKL